jgi:alpha-tubulin suppressor-like RCC1 family protein/subtilisin-like proprotein convertase family protein
MRKKVSLILSGLLAGAGAWLFWPHAGPQTTGRSDLVANGSTAAAAKNSAANAAAKPSFATLNTNKLAFRLSNTTNSLRQLEATPHAILLANAFIDTDKPLDLKMPANLKAAGDPGAYIVQARGTVNAPFRAALAQAGAQIVSYIPNNAYLVRLTAGEAGALAGSPLVQAVLPYEPYYKLQSSLLGLAAGGQTLPPGTALNLGLFATDAPVTEQQIENLGAKIIGRDQSAFGPVLRVLAPADWTQLAQVPGVQILEPSHVRVPANDLSRVTAGISPDTTSGMTNDYLGLNGKNVLVAVNDSGVDETHPDLTGRVFGLNPIDLMDTAGHGTHVAGIIGSSGINSMQPPGPTDVGAFAEGSVSNADFRGKAPLASLFSINNSRFSDYQLQTAAALTNALISNNSWDYGNGASEYDLAAASYDAATRDAVPYQTGSQPVLFVFAAGNVNPGGDNNGQGGSGDTILSPGTAKNVITVGALEQPRYITNIVTLSITPGVGTNAPTTNSVAYWQTWTDSGNQVAWYSARGNVGIGTEGNYGRFKPDVVSPGTFVVSTRSKQWNTNAYYNPTNVQTTPYLDQVVDTNGLLYYNVNVPSDAVGVTITISTNRLSPVPFPLNLPIYVRQTGIPTTNSGGYDFVTTKDGVAIPADGGSGYLQQIQGNGFNFAVGNSTNFSVNYDLTVRILTTNDLGDYYQVLEGMNETLAPYYRYESGTSMAAADVSGVLALIQDYFTNQFQPSLTPSPALLKALLINGSRSVANYPLALTNSINIQGWGMDNIQDCVPSGGLINQFNTAGSSFFVDQNPMNALATGDSHTFILNVDTNSDAQYYGLQATLVWTDPPGDPAAAIKLVNNLDLVITNLDTGDVNYGSVYFGNDISPDLGYNEPWNTNNPPNLDSINNVENILLPAFSVAAKYSVTVVGRSVNVNAVTAQTNNAAGQYAPNIVQDFALVVSIGEGEADVTNAFTVTDGGIASNPTGDQNVTVVTTTNSPLMNQFVGASSPLLGTSTLPLGTATVWGPNGVVTIGQTNQWHFYVVTNTGPAADYTNAAFITFDAVTLSIPRMGVLEEANPANATRPEADIDLYVSQDPSITNLSPVAISNCLAGVSGFGVKDGGASLGQGGTEFVFFTNSAPGQIYYVGVKSEDRMGSEYAFMPIFTDTPFSSLDKNGNQIVRGLLLPMNIPDGTPAHPGVTNVFALAVIPMIVEKVTVTNLNEHQNFGDLFGALSFSRQSVVLNNHDGFNNTYGTAPIVYDDSRNRVPGTTNSDGPGSLVNFRTKSALGPWILGEMDNSAGDTGRVSALTLLIQPHRDLQFPGVIVSLPPGGWFIDYVDVPPGYTNLTFYATNLPPTIKPQPLEMFEKLGNDPTLTDYDQMEWLTNCAVGTYPTGLDPGNSISIGPPLAQGQYFIGIYNPDSTVTAQVYISATLGINASENDIFNYTAGSGTVLPDDAVSGSTIPIPNTVTQLVSSVNVGLVVNSPRISDYTFMLVSPNGQRVLLMENRGDGTTNGAGSVFVYTNVLNATATGGPEANTNYLAVDPAGGTVPIIYNFYTAVDQMTVYDTTNASLFSTTSSNLLLNTGFTNNPPNGGGGPESTTPVTVNVTYPVGTTAITIIMNQFGNPAASGNDAWTYTAGAPITNYQYLVFTDNTNLATDPIKFAEPPFNFTESSTNYLLSDLDLATNGDYLAPTNIYDAFGGWTVPTNLVTYATIVTNGQLVLVTNVVLLTNNLVSVITDPSSSLTGDAGGSNLLALANGTITRSIATVPGHIYNVTFWYRGPDIAAWWRGEGNATDSSDPEKNNNNGTLIGRFNFPAGEVGQAFQFEDPGNTYQFAGTNTYVQVPASSSLNVGAGGGFTVEGWINPTNLARPQPLVEWLAHVPTDPAVTNIVIVQGPVLDPATGHYYYLLDATNWTTSELWAEQLGGHLATIDTANEENWVYDTFTAYGTLNRKLWIGLTNSGLNKPFGWSSGETNVTYDNWLATQPLNCDGNRNYTAILGPTNSSPTNALPGLWVLADNNGFICHSPATNRIYGVVEVSDIPTNGVQFWISGTNWTPGESNLLQGCLYANIVDTNYVSHEIFSAAGLLSTNVYQHVALTYNTNSGIAALYLNGTNVATTNLGVFVPKTDGDLLLGWDMSRYTNNFYGGQMDEMSLYSRALSLAEINAIYNVSASTTNRLMGKFDPAVTPAVGLAEALVAFGPNTNVIYGVNNQWSVNSFTFTATSNSMPLTISGIKPGILLDSFAVNEASEANLYYLPEQALESLAGNPAAGNWTLQVWDNRAGAYVTNVAQLVNWQLSFVLESNAVVSASLPPQTPVATTVPSGQIVYYSVTVPEWAHFATNILVSSSQPVDLLFFNTNNFPGNSNGPDAKLLNNSTGGIGKPAMSVNPVGGELQLQPGTTYYLGVQNNGIHAASVTLEVDYDILNLTNGVPFTGVLNTNEYNSVRYFEFDVSSNASEATFQLLQLSGNADLVVQKGAPLPTLTSSDYGSFNVGNSDEDIYVLTNSSPVALSAGRWYLGVFKRDSGLINYSVLAKELDPTNGTPAIIDLADGVPFNFTAGPGAALTNFFRFRAANFIRGGVTNNLGVRFELYNLSGNGDLTVQTNAPPLSIPFFQSSQNSGRNPELILIYTNSALTNLATDWYLGVPNREVTGISYTIVAEINTNGYFQAFPGATGSGGGAAGGGGPVTIGGHGTNGTVYHVTSTGDSGFGTLRDAVSSTNRTVVFDLSGTINLSSPLVITNSYLTIAGQTAPGGGITVAGNMTTVQSAHDVIIRDVRFRPVIVTANVAPIWSNGFEGGVDYGAPAGSHFAGGWLVDFGTVDNSDGINFISDAYEGVDFLDLDGSTPGGISTNIATTVGQSYQLSFVYSRNPDGPGGGFPNPPSMQVLLNSNLLSTVTANFTNSDVNLNWRPASYIFTATSSSTHLAFHSTDPLGDAYGILLDAISLTPVGAANTGDSLQFLNASNVIADHISAAWSANNLVSVLNSSNVTVQWSIMADSLYDTNNPHGFGSLLREGGGTLSFHHNLYADNYSGSPRLGDNLTLDFVNNVIYNWGIRSGLTGGTNDLFDSSTNGCTNQLNYVCNYLIAGPDTAIFATNNYDITNIAFFGGATNALAANWIFQTNNFMDSDTNGVLNGSDNSWGMFTNKYTRFSRAFPTPPVPVDEAFIAYERVLDFAGVNLNQRDPVDSDIVTKVRAQTGRLIATPGASPLLNSTPPYLDTDQDGIPDFWEVTFGQDPTNASNNQLSMNANYIGYTDLEEYLAWLAGPHALTVTNTPVGVDLMQLFGKTGNLSFFLTNAVNGTVYLTNVLGSVTYTGSLSNRIAVFTPTNSTAGGTNYYGYASFDVEVTNTDTVAYFGPVTVNVVVSAVPVAYANNTNTPPVLAAIPLQTIDELTLLTVTNTATDANNNLTLTYTVTLTIDTNAMNLLGWTNSYANTTNTTPVISTNGIINWKPSEAQGPGVYLITTIVTDNGVPSASATNSFSVTVNEVNTAPVLPVQKNLTLIALSTLVVTNTASDADIPPNPLTYQLSGPAGAVIDTNGIITWRPLVAQAGSVYTFTTIVTDTNPPAVNATSLSATNVFTVTVPAPFAPYAFTQPAQAVTGSTAQLNGMATPNGLPATAWFEWGTTTNYGNITAAVNVGSSFNVVYTQSTITGLELNIPYHFRLVVSNAVDVVAYGFDQLLDEANVVVWGANAKGQAVVPPGLNNVVAIAGAYGHSLAMRDNVTAVGWGENGLGQATVPANLNNLLAIAGGEFYSMVLRNDGTVAEWGDQRTPAGLTNIVEIAGGTFARLALRNNGSVLAWGADFSRLTNVPPGFSNAVAIAGGLYHSLAIKNNGTVVAWGNNSVGQLNVPAGLTNVVGIAGGAYHSLALKYDGTVVAWGDDKAGQTDVPAGLNSVVAVSAGGFNCMALRSDGRIVTWGTNDAGQCSVPVNLTNAVAISSGFSHSLALTPQDNASLTSPVVLNLTNGVEQTNAVVPGGMTYYLVNVPTNADFSTNRLVFTLNGPLNVWFSTNTPPSISTPGDVDLLPGATNGYSVLSTVSVPTNIVPGGKYYLGVQNLNKFSVAYGIKVDFHLVTSEFAPYAFTQPAQAVTGTNAQLNGMATPNGLPATAWFEWGTTTNYDHVTSPVYVGNSYNVVHTTRPINGLEMNVPYHFRLVVSNEVAVAYGFDQLLDEANVVNWGADYVKQTEVPAGLSNAVAITGAYDHSLALKNDGTVAAWGDNTFGQAAVPAGLTNVMAVAGGDYYSMALKNDGTVTAWGAGILGQTSVPPGLNNVVTIAGGTYSSLALRGDGTVVAWGASFFNLTNVPAGLSNVVAIAGGGYHNLAIRNDGTVAAWGDNSANQTAVPVGLTNVVAIACGSYHSLALKYDGTVVAWGDDSAAQTDVPPGLSNVVAVAAGGFHSLALKNDDTVVVWGDNSSGQTSLPVGLTNAVAIAAGYLHSLALTPQSIPSLIRPVVLNLTNGVPQTNSILAGGLIYYKVNVPTNADFATNSLLFTVNGPLNVWFTTNSPPAIGTNAALLLAGVTNDSSILSITSVPTNIVPGAIYYLGVQNTNGFAVNYGIEVDFHLVTGTKTVPISSIVYMNGGYLLTWWAPTNDLFQVQMTDGLPPNWQSFSNIISYSGPVTATNGQFSYFDDGSQYPFDGPRFYRLILVGAPAPATPPPVLPVQPTRIADVFNQLVVTNTATDAAVPAPTLTYTLTSTVTGTNVPVINPNTGVITWTPDLTQAGTSNELTTVVTAGGVPALSATNVFAVLVNPLPGISGVTATNGGYLLTWWAPTNDLFQVQMTDGLPPVWQSFSNIVAYSGPVTATNGLFSFFDDGSQYPFNGPRFYWLNLLGVGWMPTNSPVAGLPELPVQPTRIADVFNQLVVTNTATDATVPMPTLTYTLSSTVTGTNVPVINPNTGVVTWTPDLSQAGTSNVLTTIVTASGVPALSDTNRFAVIVNPLPGISGIIYTNISGTNGYLLTWWAPTNDLFQVQMTDGLPPNWQSFSNSVAYSGPVTVTNGLFTFFDNGTEHPFNGPRFYRLNLLGVGWSPTNPPAAVPPVLPVQPNRVADVINQLVVTNTATDGTVPAPVLTYTLTSTVTGTNQPVINPNTGIITWTPDLTQAGMSNELTTIVTASGVPALSDTNRFAVIVNPLPGISGVTEANGGYLLTWWAPTNDLFKVQMTDGLPPVWQNFTNIIAYSGPVTATNGLFTFFDNGTEYAFNGPRFYRLNLLGVGWSPTNPPPATNTIHFSGSLTTNGGFQLTWSAPTNDQFRVQWTTNLVPPFTWNLFPGTNTSTSGLFSFTDTNAPLLLKFYELILLP